MGNLLYSECYKWKKNKAFWICMLSAVCMVLLVYLTMTTAGQAMGAGKDVLKETGISGMAEQFAGGGLVTMFSAVFLCIWTVSDYTHGAMKNMVGKGYSRLIMIGILENGRMFFQNMLLYLGLQLLFGIAVSSIVIAVCEWSRNMAAGIGITMALIIFSPLLMQGIDLLLSKMHLKMVLSGYWILNLMADCPTEAFPSEFLFRGCIMAAVWTLLPLILSAVHFRKKDIA